MIAKRSNIAISWSFLLLTLLFSSVAGAFAQSPVQAGHPVIFDHLSQGDGLVNASVSSILQDDSGFLWFGTQAGLQRFDGRRMLLFTNQPFADNQLSHHLVQTLHYDGGDILWVGTYGGLNQLNTATNEFRVFAREAGNSRSLSNDIVTAVATDANGTVWAATLNGLNRIDDEQQRDITRFMPDEDDPHAMPHHTVRALQRGSDGTLWVGSLGGLSRVLETADGEVHFETRSEDLLSPFVMAIDEDPEGRLWVGTWDGGAQRIGPDGSVDRSYHLPDNRIYQLLVSSDGRVYVATWGGGLVIIDPVADRYSVYRTNGDDPYSLAHDVVYSLFEDRSGVVWIGTNGNGVSRLDPQRQDFRYVHHNLPADSRLPAGKVNTLFKETETGRLFIGVQQQGLHVRDPQTGQLTAIRHDPEDTASLSNDHVTAIVRHGDELLLATNGGVDLLDPETLEVERLWDTLVPDAGPGPIVYALLSATDGSLWIGTYDAGVYRRMPDGRIFRYEADEDADDSLTNNLIYTIYEDADGSVWVGTNVGLNRYQPETGTFRQYLYDPADPVGISDNSMVHAFEDSAGRLWFATRSGGIMQYHSDSDSFTHVTMEDGLSSNLVRAITEGEDGTLVIATMNGINIFDVDTGRIDVVDERDGLGTREFSSGGIRLSNGDTLFGAFQEIVRIPAGLRSGTGSPPMIQITDILVLNEPVDTDLAPHHIEHLTFDHTQNVITVSFSALDFISPERNCFQYRLLGFSDDWIPCDGSQRATFTNLAPGEYVFEVTGRNSRGIAALEPARLRITIVPPFWQTRWFYAFTLLLSFGGVLMVLYLRERSLRRRARRLQIQVDERTVELSQAVTALEESNATKDRFFSILSHDLRGPITGMNRLMERIVSNPEDFSPDELTEIHEALLQTSRGLGSMLENLLEWSRLQRNQIALDTQEIPVDALIRSVIEAYQVAAHAKNIDIGLSCTEELQVYSDIHRVRTIIENLLNNAIKFTPVDGSVTVGCTEVDRDGHSVARIEIHDTGKGIPAHELKRIFMIDEVFRTEGTAGERGSGLGLTLCRELAERLGGRVWLESEEGHGTQACLEL
ncbi:MAG: hypothetical protein EA383_13180, partial [Spirochaetaceae bacterium]